MVEPDLTILQRRIRELEDQVVRPHPGGGGGGAQPPDIERRPAALQEQAKDTRDVLHRLDTTLARVEATLASLASKGDLLALTAKVDGMDKRLGSVEAAVADTLRTAANKAIGPVQLPAIIVACGAAYMVLSGLWRYLAAHGWLPP